MLAPEEILYAWKEVQTKASSGQCKVLQWDDDIKDDFPANLKSSPVVVVPQKIREFRMVLDLSFPLHLVG